MKRKVCPLDLLIGLGAPTLIEFKLENGIKITAQVRPMRMRTVLALWGITQLQNAEPLTINANEVAIIVLKDCITKLWIGDELVEDYTLLHPWVVSALFDLCLQLNGITEPGASLLQQELDKIAKISQQMMDEDADAPDEVSPYYHLAQIAYSALSAGGKVTADYWIDEPYLLILAALAVARGERDYFRRKMKETESKIHSTKQIDMLSAEAQKLLNAPPVTSSSITPPSIKIVKGNDTVEEMIKLAEKVAGLKIKK